METKKTESADVHKKSGLFLSLGLFVSCAALVAVFESRQLNSPEQIALMVDHTDTDIQNIPPTTIEPPKPAPITPTQLIEVPENDVIPDIHLTLDPDEIPLDIPPIPEPVADLGEATEEIIDIVEEKAEPEGGFSKFYAHLKTNMKYPKPAQRYGIGGKVFCQFVVNKDGSIQDVKIIRGIGGGCDEEAIRVIQTSPKWKPGKQRGRPVRSRFSLAIQFDLGHN